MSGGASSIRGLFGDRWLRAVMVTGMLVHAVWIGLVLTASANGEGTPLWYMPDTPSYLENARMLKEGLPLSPVFRERLLLPLLIASVTAIGLPPQSILWILWLMHLPAVWAVISITRTLNASLWAARGSAVLYFLWPAVFASGVQLGTDMLHAQLVLLATASTVRWVERGDRYGQAAILFWILVQLVRPSFYPAALVLIPFLIRLLRSPACGMWPALLCIVSLALVPVTFTALNRVQYGIAAPSLAGVESLHRNVVARIRALQRNERSPGSMTAYFEEEREVAARNDADWQALAIYRAGTIDPDFATHYRNLQEKGRAFVGSNRVWFVRSSMLEVENQLRRVHGVPWISSAAGGTAGTEQILLRMQKIGLLLGLLGWAVALRQSLPYASFLALCVGLILSACSMLWWESSRIRMPVEALAIPCIASILPRRQTWISLAGIAIAGWAPIRLLGWPEAWLGVTVGAGMIWIACHASSARIESPHA